ncbi:MAG: trypsin-like serine protease [Alphaproteobacteria bacterium]|nr:trypsin-like serine protease [Alphaproteobacteria bacterium]
MQLCSSHERTNVHEMNATPAIARSTTRPGTNKLAAFRPVLAYHCPMKRIAIIGIFLGVLIGGTATADMDVAIKQFEVGNYDAALDELIEHVEAGDPAAQTMAAYIYDFGLVGEPDFELAAALYTLAAVQGDSLAQYFLAGLYFDGLGVEQDYTEAAYWYEQSAAQGDPDAQYYLALMFQSGDGVPADDFVSAEWMRLAADAGDPRAQYEMGINYDFGYGVEQDYGIAAEWYLYAAEQGHDGAQFELAFNYSRGIGVEQSDSEAAFWYSLSADQGNGLAQLAMGKIFDEGRGVPQDFAEGARYYLLAAEQGIAEAQYELAVDYEYGYGVSADMIEAIFWYRQAAEQGHAEAQYNMAVDYSIGDGVAQDLTQGAWWMIQAGMQGHEFAQVSLGFIYRQGEGVSADPLQAYMWLALAAQNWGNETAIEALEDLEATLSTAQIDLAKKLVLQFEAGGFQPTLAPPDPTVNLVPPVADPGIANQDVSRTQAALADLGYSPGPADGIAGAQTQAAIRQFEEDYGLPVTGQVSDELSVALLVARAAEARRPTRGGLVSTNLEIVATGTGFVITDDGHVITNNHVIAGCSAVRVRTGSQQTVDAEVRAAEPDSDLALLMAPDLRVADTAAFRAGRGIRPADDVVVIGYPLFGAELVTSTEAIVTTGAVSALAGPGDDRRIMQITAPVQPGNSGGPLLDGAGNVVGVVVAKLDAILVAEAIGDIPQNVNFAIQG